MTLTFCIGLCLVKLKLPWWCRKHQLERKLYSLYSVTKIGDILITAAAVLPLLIEKGRDDEEKDFFPLYTI